MKFATIFSTWKASNLKNLVWNKTKLFEDFERLIGLRSIHDSYIKVGEAEKSFVKSSEIRRDIETKLQATQDRLRELNSEKDNLSRYDDRYLKIFMEEHNLIKEVAKLNDALDAASAVESKEFSILADELRKSHEQEMMSLRSNNRLLFLGSSLCVLIGFVSTLAFHHYRVSRIRRLVLSSLALKADPGSSTKESEQPVLIGVSEEKEIGEVKPLYVLDYVRQHFNLDWDAFLEAELQAAVWLSLSTAVMAVFLYSY